MIEELIAELDKCELDKCSAVVAVADKLKAEIDRRRSSRIDMWQHLCAIDMLHRNMDSCAEAHVCMRKLCVGMWGCPEAHAA